MVLKIVTMYVIHSTKKLHLIKKLHKYFEVKVTFSHVAKIASILYSYVGKRKCLHFHRKAMSAYDICTLIVMYNLCVLYLEYLMQ